MICSSIYSTFNTNLYPKEIREAIGFFRATDFGALNPGEYEIDGRDVFYQVIDTTTKAMELGKPEVHRKYIDIQFLVKGKETIGYVDDNGSNEIDEDLLEQRDLLFYKGVKDLTFIAMTEGDFCVFFPCDVHVPGCEREGIADIRKIVYKVRYSLLEKQA